MKNRADALIPSLKGIGVSQSDSLLRVEQWSDPVTSVEAAGPRDVGREFVTIVTMTPIRKIFQPSPVDNGVVALRARHQSVNARGIKDFVLHARFDAAKMGTEVGTFRRMARRLPTRSVRSEFSPLFPARLAPICGTRPLGSVPAGPDHERGGTAKVHSGRGGKLGEEAGRIVEQEVRDVRREDLRLGHDRLGRRRHADPSRPDHLESVEVDHVVPGRGKVADDLALGVPALSAPDPRAQPLVAPPGQRCTITSCPPRARCPSRPSRRAPESPGPMPSWTWPPPPLNRRET